MQAGTGTGSRCEVLPGPSRLQPQVAPGLLDWPESHPILSEGATSAPAPAPAPPPWDTGQGLH